MRSYRKTSTILVIIALLSLFTTPTAISNTTEQTPAFLGQYRLFSQMLFVSIQPSLYAYYSKMTHALTYDSDYAKLITPQAVQPIADNILKFTSNMPYSDEHFANAVLSLVHQIPYNISGAKYPIEILVNNYGDCGGLSLLAASIMKAGGLDVVLIKYTGIDPGHMNVGVYLPYTPVYHSLLMSATSFQYNNKTYWAAEATPQGDWKVGDQSYKIANAIPIIIPINEREGPSPGQVSSSLVVPPSFSTITINLSPQTSSPQDSKRSLTISGSIQPKNPNSSITLYINKKGVNTNYSSILTDNFGNYAYAWNFTSDGTYFITTSWSGNSTFAGADSETLVVFVGPEALMQFETDTYNYIIGSIFADAAVRPFLGVEDFLNIPLGTNISLSYNFIVLQTGHSASEIQTENITKPASEYKVRTRNRQMTTIHVPAQTIVVPTNIPPGMQPLTLPRDFNQTINSKFSFIIGENLEGTYSFSVKGLNEYDVSNMKQENETNTAFINATQDIEESIWYKVNTTITKNDITADLQREDGTLIKSQSASNSSEGSKQLVMIIANNIDSAVVLKDLKIKTVNTTIKRPEIVNQTPSNSDLPLSYFSVVVVLAATLSAIIYVRKRKQ